MNSGALFLVTGSTGLLGNNVVRHLLAAGMQVRVTVRENSNPAALADLEVERAVVDFRDARATAAAIAGCSHVIHAAGDTHIGWRRWHEARETNVGGTRLVAQAALEQDARLIHVSTVDTLPASSDGTPTTEEAPFEPKLNCTYVITKQEAEQEVLKLVDKGLNATIVNPGFMLGPFDWKPSSGKMLQAVAGGMLTYPVGGMSGCDVRDVADGILAAAERGKVGERYILAGENISYRDAWQLMADVTGSRAPKLPIGPMLRFVVGRSADLFSLLSGKEGDVNSAMMSMSKLLHYYDSAKAMRELDYRIRPFRESVEAAWDWLRDNDRR